LDTPNLTAIIPLNASVAETNTYPPHVKKPRVFQQNVLSAMVTTLQTTGDAQSTRNFNLLFKKKTLTLNPEISLELSSFLEELKNLICPLISLLTTVINKLIISKDD